MSQWFSCLSWKAWHLELHFRTTALKEKSHCARPGNVLMRTVWHLKTPPPYARADNLCSMRNTESHAWRERAERAGSASFEKIRGNYAYPCDPVFIWFRKQPTSQLLLALAYQNVLLCLKSLTRWLFPI